MHTHTHTHASIHITHTSIHIHSITHIYTHIHTYIHIHIHAHSHTHTFNHTRAFANDWFVFGPGPRKIHVREPHPMRICVYISWCFLVRSCSVCACVGARACVRCKEGHSCDCGGKGDAQPFLEEASFGSDPLPVFQLNVKPQIVQSIRWINRCFPTREDSLTAPMNQPKLCRV